MLVPEEPTGIFLVMQDAPKTRKQALMDLVRDASLEVTPAGAQDVALPAAGPGSDPGRRVAAPSAR